MAKLTDEIIEAARHGDLEAQMHLLNYYDRYINALATVEVKTSNGRLTTYVDEDMKAEIQLKYLEALPKYRVLNQSGRMTESNPPEITPDLSAAKETD